MIIAHASTPEEARDLADVLAVSLPAGLSYRIFLLGSEYQNRIPSGEPPPRHELVRELVRKASPEGITVREIFVELHRLGQPAAKPTIHRWLNEDLDAGRVVNVRGCWTARDAS